MSAREMESMKAFLQHSGREGFSNKLGDWKKKKKVNTFLHTRVLPIALWRHQWHRLVVRDEGIKVWSDNLNCHEDEKVLKRQFKRNDDGSRKFPPRACPLCRLLEAVRELLDGQKIKWTAPIFRFKGDEDDVVIHAGGILGEFGKDDLDDDEKKLLKDAGIVRREAWKEAAWAKLSYVFYVVDADNVDKGLQMAIETSLLGDKVKDVINDQLESLGEDKGDVMKHPYCIQWQYDDAENLPFNKKYSARRLERVQMTEEIEEIIRGPKPDYAAEIAPFKANAEFRAMLEKACVPEVRKLFNWDAIFAPPTDAPRDERSRHPDVDDVEPEAPATTATSPGPADDEIVGCDDCGKEMKISAPKCPHCGKVYEVTAEATPPPPPPPTQRRSRSAAKKSRAAASDASEDEDGLPF